MDVAEIGGGVLAGLALPFTRTIWRKLTGASQAEARLTNAKADSVIIRNLSAEVERLSNEVKQLRDDFEVAQRHADDEKAMLERENRSLKGKISRLETRVTGLESILSIGPITPEMKAALDELDRKTGSK